MSTMINSNNNDNEPSTEPPVPTLPPVENVWKKRAEESKPKPQAVQQSTPVKEKSSQPEPKFHKSYQGSNRKHDNSEQGSHRNNYQKEDSKPFVRKELSPEEKKLRDEKTMAFNLAQDTAIKKCVDRCNPKVRDDINGCLSYEVNYRRTLVMDITDDDIVVEVNGNKHVYSLKRFLENRYFQNKLRDEYTSVLPDACIRLFPGRDEGTFCIGIQRRKS